MTELAETFKAMKLHNKNKRQQNLEDNTRKLLENMIEYKSYNHGYHLVIDDKIKFYPSTGVFIVRSTKQKGKGFNNMMKIYRELKTIDISDEWIQDEIESISGIASAERVDD